MPENNILHPIWCVSAEYGKGNYVIGGGDFNKDLLGDSAAVFGVNGGDYTWAQPISDGMFANTGLTLVVPEGKNGPVPTCRNADGPYNPKQYILTVDGFIVSDNVRAEHAEAIDTGFAYSDHNPISMTFTLMDR